MQTILTPADASQLSAETRFLDVRTPAEFETEHIPGSYNVPLDLLSDHAAEICRVESPVVLVCRTGSRAGQAAELLRRSGMQNLHILDGGIVSWQESRLPIRRGRQKLTLERQVRIGAGFLAAAGGLLALSVNPWFAVVPTFVGFGLMHAGLTNRCGMAMVLAWLPYNRAGCDLEDVVSRLLAGQAAEKPSAGCAEGCC